LQEAGVVIFALKSSMAVTNRKYYQQMAVKQTHSYSHNVELILFLNEALNRLLGTLEP